MGRDCRWAMVDNLGAMYSKRELSPFIFLSLLSTNGGHNSGHVVSASPFYGGRDLAKLTTIISRVSPDSPRIHRYLLFMP